jgi:hypothetical protein
VVNNREIGSHGDADSTMSPDSVAPEAVNDMVEMPAVLLPSHAKPCDWLAM